MIKAAQANLLWIRPKSRNALLQSGLSANNNQR
jgi:hypothetical protein